MMKRKEREEVQENDIHKGGYLKKKNFKMCLMIVAVQGFCKRH